MTLTKKLLPEFYTGDDTLEVAQNLLGKILVVIDENGHRISGKIVETEAYLGPRDKAAHSYNNRRTPRNEVMYGKGGVAYVFFVYGMYFQFNVVTGQKDSPQAILIRGIEPVEGIETIRKRRGKMEDQNLTSGPGKLCIALGIDKSFNGAELQGERVWIEDNVDINRSEIVAGPRIGINYAKEYVQKPWRFWMKQNLYVSR